MTGTIFFNNKPIIIGAGTVAGPKESNGPLRDYFQEKLQLDTFGEDSYERAESKILYTAIKHSINNCNMEEKDVDVIIAGDLLNQIISSTFAARRIDSAYLGVYSACASFCESLIFGAVLVDGGYLKNAICATSSHFSSAERQYRYPLELGSTRPPQSQWTVTGAGATVLSSIGGGPAITCATIGKVVDYGVTDVNNMGAAMAPAACFTVVNHLKESNRTPDYYDLIVTGDLGALGSRIFKHLALEKGYDLEKQHVDCGELIFNICEDEYQGGSGAGCSSLVFNSYLLTKMKEKSINKILLVTTGALLSSLSSQQGDSIPGIAHAVAIENVD